MGVKVVDSRHFTYFLLELSLSKDVLKSAFYVATNIDGRISLKYYNENKYKVCIALRKCLPNETMYRKSTNPKTIKLFASVSQKTVYSDKKYSKSI